MKLNKLFLSLVALPFLMMASNADVPASLRVSGSLNEADGTYDQISASYPNGSVSITTGNAHYYGYKSQAVEYDDGTIGIYAEDVQGRGTIEIDVIQTSPKHWSASASLDGYVDDTLQPFKGSVR